MAKKYVWIGLLTLLALTVSRCTQNESDMIAFMQAVRQLIRPVAAVYLMLFGQPETTLILSFLMATACASLLIYFWLAQIRGAVNSIRALTGQILSYSLVPVGQEREATSRLMAGMRLLEDEWKIFEATLIEVEGIGNGRLHTTVRPHEYFTMEAMESRGLNFRILYALPGYFVGFGLLFTFLGLVAGLFFASKGMQTTEFAAARLALGKLLNASTLKFVSSVVGIGASLVTSITVLAWAKAVQGALDDLCRAIELRFPALSPSFLAVHAKLSASRKTESIG